jgi:hypothetical protein
MSCEVGASYGIAVRLPSFIVAASAYRACEKTLHILDFCISRSPLWRSKQSRGLGGSAFNRLTPEIWTRIRRHTLDNALDDEERAFLAEYLRFFDCGCSQAYGLPLPTKLRTVRRWWASFQCGHWEKADFRDIQVNDFMRDRIESIAVREASLRLAEWLLVDKVGPILA